MDFKAFQDLVGLVSSILGITAFVATVIIFVWRKMQVRSRLTLYVNGLHIATATEPNQTVSGKQIGFEVDAGSSLAANAVFSDVQVWAP
jgi:hypothetical protein